MSRFFITIVFTVASFSSYAQSTFNPKDYNKIDITLVDCDPLLNRLIQSIEFFSNNDNISLLQDKKALNNEFLQIINSLKKYDTLPTVKTLLSDIRIIHRKFNKSIDAKAQELVMTEKERKNIMGHYQEILDLVQNYRFHKRAHLDALGRFLLQTEIERLNNITQQIFFHIDSSISNLNSLNNTRYKLIDESLDSISTLTDYGPIYVGPSLYVENTYGFNFFIGGKIITDVFSIGNEKVSLMPEILFFSNGVDRRFGGSLYFGYDIMPDKIIPQVMIQYLNDKRSIETSDNNSFHAGIGILFKNREWMAGFAYSPISGGGIKLLIGL